MGMDFADRVMPAPLIRSDQPRLASCLRLWSFGLTRFVSDSSYLRVLEPNWLLDQALSSADEQTLTSISDVTRYPGFVPLPDATLNSETEFGLVYASNTAAVDCPYDINPRAFGH